MKSAKDIKYFASEPHGSIAFFAFLTKSKSFKAAVADKEEIPGMVLVMISG